MDLVKISNLCKRRGIIFQDSEIYGGLNGFWNYGPYGIEIKKNLENLWWKYMVSTRDNIIGQDASIINHPVVWQASGHTEQFADFMVDNKITKKRYKLNGLLEQQKEEILTKLSEKFSCKVDIDELESHLIKNLKQCPEIFQEMKLIDPFSNKLGDWTEPRQFNLMMSTSIGSINDENSKAYLRAETCQAIFTNFSYLQKVSRKKLPFGIAQIGKAFRNEINPRNFIFRSREFSQMEMEFFCRKEESEKWFHYWHKEREKFFIDILSFKKENLRVHHHTQLAHYAKMALDIEYKFPFGWGELEGIHHRGEWDLTRHEKFSKKNLKYFCQETNTHFIPTVVESSVGVDRLILAILCDSYSEETLENKEERIVLKLPVQIAPVQVAILPLVKKLNEKSKKIFNDLQQYFRVELDSAGAIGRRYRRQDEIGTPFCLTVDFDGEKDNTLTIRERDSMKQERINISNLKNYLLEKLK